MKSNIKLDKIDAGENYDEHPQDDDIEKIGSKVTLLFMLSSAVAENGENASGGKFRPNRGT